MTLARDPALWMTRRQCAELVGLSPQQFDDAVRPRLGDDATNGAGRTLRFDGPAVVAALVKYRLEQAKPAPPLSEDEAMILGGGDSPQLERFRKLKGDMLERDLGERDAELVRRRVMLDALRPAAAGMRAAGARLAKDYGNDAAAIFNEAVDDFANAVKQMIGNDATAVPG